MTPAEVLAAMLADGDAHPTPDPLEWDDTWGFVNLPEDDDL